MQKLFEFDEHIGDWRVLIQSRDIMNGSIQGRHIAPGAITTDKLAPGSIDPEKLRLPPIKTINGIPLYGEGDIAIDATGEPIDLSPYALKEEIPDISGKADKSEIPDVSGFATKSEIPDVSNFATKSEIPDTSNFATKQEIPTIPHFKTINGEEITGEGNIVISGGGGGGYTPDLSEYALKSEIPDISGKADKSEIPDVSNLATKAEIPDISNLATKAEIPVIPSFKTINGQQITGEGNITITGDGTAVDLSDYALKSEIPDTTNLATKSEIPTVDNEVTANSNNPVKSSGVASFVTSTINGKFVVLTEQQYNAMETHDPETFYFIKE